MSETISIKLFSNELLTIFEETFNVHQGIYLDKGTSLIETLDQLPAEQASIGIGNNCATIAAQLAHVIFYLEVLERYIMGEDFGKQNWGEVWQTVDKVTDDEWSTLKETLKDCYLRIKRKLENMIDWDSENPLAGSLAIVVHTAYHLGEIRQALCTLPN